MLKRLWLLFLLFGALLIPLISSADLSNSLQQTGEWKETYSTDNDYFSWAKDKNKKKTEVCLLHLTATKLNDLPQHKNLYDKNGELIIVLNRKKVKQSDSGLDKDYYGFCRNIDNEVYLKFGEYSTILEFDNILTYDFDWGQTNITLYRENETESNIIAFWNYEEDKYEFGANITDLPDGVLERFKYKIESTDTLIPVNLEHVNSDGSINNYPSIYNYYPNDWNELRHFYSFGGICTEDYADCNYTIIDEKNIEIDFNSYNQIQTKSIQNVSGCKTINASGVYELNQSINSSATCIQLSGAGFPPINLRDVVVDCKGYSIKYASSSAGHGFSSSIMNLWNITIKNCKINQSSTIASSHGIFLSRPFPSYFYNNTIYTFGSNSNNMNVPGTYAPSKMQIYDNYLFSNGSGSINLYADTTTLSNIYNNTFVGSGGKGIELGDYSYDSNIFNNSCLLNGSTSCFSIDVPSPTYSYNLSFYDNYIDAEVQQCFFLETAHDIYIYNNTCKNGFVGNSWATYRRGVTFGEGALNGLYNIEIKNNTFLINSDYATSGGGIVTSTNFKQTNYSFKNNFFNITGTYANASGIVLLNNVSDVVVEDNKFYFDNPNSQLLRFANVPYISYFYNNEFTIYNETSYFLQLKDFNQSAYFENNTITNAGKTYLLEDTTNTLVNFTNTTGLDTTYDTIGTLGNVDVYVKWFYQAYVNDSNDNPVTNAKINIKDNNEEEIINLTTSSSGFTGLYVLTDYFWNATDTIYSSLYNNTAIKSLFSNNQNWNATEEENGVQYFYINANFSAIYCPEDYFGVHDVNLPYLRNIICE